MDYQEEMNNIIEHRKYVNITPDAVISLEKAGVIDVKKTYTSITPFNMVEYYVIVRKMIVDKSNVDSDNCIIGTGYEAEYSPECDTYYYLEETVINWGENFVKNMKN